MLSFTCIANNHNYERFHRKDKLFVSVGTPYDLKSIMHYKEKDGIEPLYPLNKIEPSKILSDIDVIEIRRAYKCSGRTL